MLHLRVFFLILSSLFSFTTTSATLAETWNDSIITAKIAAKFAENEVNPLKLSVSTQKGIVILKGHVENKQDFRKALTIAQSTAGVTSVNSDNLFIKKVNLSVFDAYITAKVEAAILAAKVLDDPSISLVGIHASTNNGIVTLEGKLANKHAISSILKRIKSIAGVVKVVSKLTISSTN